MSSRSHCDLGHICSVTEGVPWPHTPHYRERRRDGGAVPAARGAPRPRQPHGQVAARAELPAVLLRARAERHGDVDAAGRSGLVGPRADRQRPGDRHRRLAAVRPPAALRRVGRSAGRPAGPPAHHPGHPGAQRGPRAGPRGLGVHGHGHARPRLRPGAGSRPGQRRGHPGAPGLHHRPRAAGRLHQRAITELAGPQRGSAGRPGRRGAAHSDGRCGERVRHQRGVFRRRDRGPAAHGPPAVPRRRPHAA